MNETGEAPSFWRLAARSKHLRKGTIYAVLPFTLGCFLLLLAFLVAESANQRLSFGLIGALSVVLGAMCLRGGIREIREWKRLAREGITAQGVVTLVKEIHEDVFPLWLSLVFALLTTRMPHEVKGWVVFYNYDGNGTKCSGESGLLPRAEAEKWSVGDQCAIKYDLKQPEKSVWIGK